MKAVHFGVTPGTITDAIVSALETLTPVKTVKRIQDDDEATLKRAIATGAGGPMLLVFYGGGVYALDSAGEQSYDDTLAYTVFAVAGRSSAPADRWTGGEHDSDLATDPGVEELQDWALYLSIRAAEVTGATQVIALRHTQAVQMEPGRWIGQVEFTARRGVDLYDDAVTTTLVTLGLVKNPSDPPDLFEGDNVTPKSDEPPDTAGGVFELP